MMIKLILDKLVPIVIFSVISVGVYFAYAKHTALIRQTVEQEQAMEALGHSIVAMDKAHKEELEITKFEVAVKTRKEAIKEGLMYDKNKSVDINSTKYYILD